MQGHCLIELPRVKTKSVPTFYFFSRLGFDDLLIYYHTFIKFYMHGDCLIELLMVTTELVPIF